MNRKTRKRISCLSYASSECTMCLSYVASGILEEFDVRETLSELGCCEDCYQSSGRIDRVRIAILRFGKRDEFMKIRGNKKRDCQVNVKLSDREKASLEYEAEKVNMYRNAFVAMILRDYVNTTNT